LCPLESPLIRISKLLSPIEINSKFISVSVGPYGHLSRTLQLIRHLSSYINLTSCDFGLAACVTFYSGLIKNFRLCSGKRTGLKRSPQSTNQRTVNVSFHFFPPFPLPTEPKLVNKMCICLKQILKYEITDHNLDHADRE